MQNKLNKVWEKIIASVLVIALTAGNLMLIGSSMISYAEANLENQNETTAHENVEFGAYFESEGNNVHSLVCDAEAKEKLYIHLNVKEAGYLKTGKIEILEANYSVTGEIEESEIIGNREGNSFELKQIDYGTEAILELPISLEIGEKFNTSNINKNSKVILTGTYVTTDGEEVAIEKEITLNIAWTSQAEIEVASELLTYKKYENSAEKGVIVQEKIIVKTAKESLPVQRTKIEVMAPSFINERPEEVRVNSRRTEMTNGKTNGEVELTAQYNEETGIVTIEVENQADNGEVYSKLGGKDEFIVTYEYGEDAFKYAEDGMEYRREAKVTVETYSHKEANKADETITKTDTLTEEIGNVINGEIEIVEEINKAKIYANYNSNNREYETEYELREVIGIAKADIVEDIVIEGEEESFIGIEQEEKSLTVEAVDYTYYKSTKIAVENFNKILGNTGSIVIEDEEGPIGTIDASIEAEEGYYVITYAEKPENIKITTSSPIAEGDLILEHEKAIKADLGYSKEEAKGFSEIKITKQVGQSKEETLQEVEGKQKLTEAVSHLNLISNKESINKEEDTIELRLEFGNDEENSILYSNPIVKITLPEFIEVEADVEKLKAEVLFDEELEVGTKQITKGENGETIIQIELKGTQTRFNTIETANGTTLVIGASLTCNKSGEGTIIADIEENTATKGIVSCIGDEQKQDSLGEAVIEESEEESGLTNEETEGEKQEKQIPRIDVVLSSAKSKVGENDTITYIMYVSDITNYEELIVSEINPFKLKNILVKNFLPSGVTYESASIEKYNQESGQYVEIENAVDYDVKNRVVTWDVNDIPNDVPVMLKLEVTADLLNEGVYEKEISNSVTASYEGIISAITSNTVKVTVAKPHINIIKTTDNVNNINKEGDIVKLILKGENVGGQTATDFKVTMSLPEELEPIRMKYGVNEEIYEVSQSENYIELWEINLEPKATYLFEIEARIKALPNEYTEQYKEVTAKATMNNNEVSWTINIELHLRIQANLIIQAILSNQAHQVLQENQVHIQ